MFLFFAFHFGGDQKHKTTLNSYKFFQNEPHGTGESDLLVIRLAKGSLGKRFGHTMTKLGKGVQPLPLQNPDFCLAVPSTVRR